MTTITTDTPESESLRVAIDRQMLDVRTAVPCVVVGVSPNGEWVDVQPAISLTKRIDDEATELPLPVVRRVPVCHPGSTVLGLTVSIPIVVGDDGDLVIQDRAIDNWQDGEGVGRAPDMQTPRHHDLTDGVFYPGLRRASKPIEGYDPTAIELRNEDGTCRLSVTVDAVLAEVGGVAMRMTETGTLFTGNVLVDGNLGTVGQGGAPGDITINGALTVTGSLSVTGSGNFGGPVTAPAFNEG